MTRASSWTLALTAAAYLVGGLAGCSGEENVTPEESPTPAPTPTPSPTPDPNLEAQYLTTAFAIAPETVGFDLDGEQANGDAAVDNNLPVVLNTINSKISETVITACQTTFPDPEDAAKEEACETAATTALTTVLLSVDDLNTQIATLIDNGSLVYLEGLDGTIDDVTLSWYDGDKNAAGAFVANYSLGSQSGSIDGTDGLVGPGMFTYYLTDSLKLNVIQTYATFAYTANVEGGTVGSLGDGVLGGAVLESDIEQLLRDLIPSQTPDQQTTEDEIVAAVLEAIDPYMDLTIGTDQKAFSAAFTFESTWQTFAGP
jgi:hypothetical protein